MHFFYEPIYEQIFYVQFFARISKLISHKWLLVPWYRVLSQYHNVKIESAVKPFKNLCAFRIFERSYWNAAADFLGQG